MEATVAFHNAVCPICDLPILADIDQVVQLNDGAGEAHEECTHDAD